MFRRFWLVRNEDETGISGEGYVAHGVVFEDGSVAMKWRTQVGSLGYYTNIADVIDIHGHNGRTVIEWIDE